MKENNLRCQAAFLLAEELLIDVSPQIVQALAQSVARTQDNDIQQGVLRALEKLSKQALYNTIWEVWTQSRSPELETLLIKRGKVAEKPLKLKVFSSLLLGQKNWMHKAGAEIIDPLLTAAEDESLRIAEGAQEALKSLDKPECQEELCRWVIEHNHPQARKTALAAGLAPSDPYHRALFFLLTEQWEEYDTLDFDTSLLKAIYQTSDQKTRAKITKLARRTGWTGYVDAITTKGDVRSIQQVDDSQWKVILSVLGRSQRWEDIWRLAQEAPPFWSAQLLRELGDAGWQPEDSETQNGYKQLLGQALNCLGNKSIHRKLVSSTSTHRGHTRRITSLAFYPQTTPDSTWFATASSDSTLCLWRNEEHPACELLTGHNSFITCLAFNPDGQTLASGSADRSVRIWNASDGSLLQILGGHAGEISALTFSPNGKILATSDSITVKLWDTHDNRLIKILPSQGGKIIQLIFSPSGDYLVSVEEDKSCHLFNVESGQLIKTIMERVTSASISSQSSRGKETIATASPYGKVRLWSLPEGKLESTLDERIDGKLISFSPNERLLAASDRELIRLWDISQEELIHTFHGPRGRISTLMFSPDGSNIACAAEDRTLWLWQLYDGKNLYQVEGLQHPVNQLIFSENGEYLIFAEQEIIIIIKLANFESFLKKSPSAISPHLIETTEAILESTPTKISQLEWDWLEFTKSLTRWRGRFDIELDSTPSHITLGEFDIEIAG